MKRTAEDWDKRYQEDEIPWDTHRVSPHLMEVFHDVPFAFSDRCPKTWDIGCGTGMNARWLAAMDTEAIGSDISQAAIDMAASREVIIDQGSVEYVCNDILKSLPVEQESIDFAFDRGCFHMFDREDRETFVEQIAKGIRPNGWWLSLCGNADEDRGDKMGPPQLRAGYIIDAVEPWFEVYRMSRIELEDRDGETFLGWSVVMRRRPSRRER